MQSSENTCSSFCLGGLSADEVAMTSIILGSPMYMKPVNMFCTVVVTSFPSSLPPEMNSQKAGVIIMLVMNRHRTAN